jgi:hypothetical protein
MGLEECDSAYNRDLSQDETEQKKGGTEVVHHGPFPPVFQHTGRSGEVSARCGTQDAGSWLFQSQAMPLLTRLPQRFVPPGRDKDNGSSYQHSPHL